MIQEIGMFCKKHGALIFSCVSIAGVTATAVLTARATVKAVTLAEEKKKAEKKEKLTAAETVQTVWQTYIPAVLVGTATIGCIACSAALSVRQQASLIGAYAMLEGRFENYISSVKELYGKDADEKVRIQTAKRSYIPTGAGVLDGTEEEVLFYDEISDRYFTSSKEQVTLAIYHLNRNFVLRGYAPLSEFYEFLGIDIPEGSDAIGWCIEMGETFYGYIWIDFDVDEVELDDGDDGIMMAYVIRAPFPPTADYLDYT